MFFLASEVKSRLMTRFANLIWNKCIIWSWLKWVMDIINLKFR
jgi:hypothetical protein